MWGKKTPLIPFAEVGCIGNLCLALSKIKFQACFELEFSKTTAIHFCAGGWWSLKVKPLGSSVGYSTMYNVYIPVLYWLSHRKLRFWLRCWLRYWLNRETANIGLDSSVGRVPAVRYSGGHWFKSRSSQFKPQNFKVSGLWQILGF